MRRCLSIALAAAAILNLWAVSAGPLAQQPAPAPAPEPQGGRAVDTSDVPAGIINIVTGNRAELTKTLAEHDEVDGIWYFGSDLTGSTLVEKSSVGNLKRTWVNNGNTQHTATASNGSFYTGTLKKGQSASHTFSSAGTFAYVCTIHPFMKGTVVVAAAAGTSAPKSSGSAPSSGTPASPTAPPTTSTREGGPTPAGGLPNTGVDVVPLLLSGVLLLASGLVLRRLTWRSERG